ncbi:uncharacterized protein LOC130804300 isoform X1 [Amaranthus tricolor]|uniref:uncharacterized protein LOC130804300 isoform X1 n=1 Tax=Amaranthus tricolor TaxID=29722 RepID=UPI002587F27C|nr:uncharacterized protein LOC130804300 isoform X1 [Amaranthus tricolor]
MEINLETRLNKAFCENRDDEVIRLCSMTAEGALLKCSVHNHTVLHVACYSKKFQLANQLIEQLPENMLCELPYRTNNWGCTILHDASTSNKGLDLVRKLLQIAPQLLHARNNWGETAVFQTSRYGKWKNFEFLAGEVDKFCEVHKEVDHLQFFQRDDKTTILHMAILAGNYDIALTIARKYPHLFGVRAQDRMTALQLLACSPTAFKSGTKLGFLRELVYSSVSADDQQILENEGAKANSIIHKALTFILDTGTPCCILPLMEEVRMMKKRHENALKLAKILIESDTSWKDTYKPCAEVIPVIIDTNTISSHKFGEEGWSSRTQKETKGDSLSDRKSSVNNLYPQVEDDIESSKTSHSMLDNDETPLHLAVKKGCIEIVDEILDVFPQAVGYLNHVRQNLFHVAIKHRNLSIFKLVDRGFPLVRGHLRDTDDEGNSILHMVGSAREVLVDGKLKSPVLQLSEDLLLLEYLKKLCPSCLVNHRNNQMLTADELFALNNETLRTEAKEWLKRTAEHCTVVIVLVATVAFAAAYTIPGGPNQQTGVPLLLGQPFFLVFTMTDVLSLGFALTAVVIFLSILTSSYQLKDFKRSLPQKLLLGFSLLFLSVSMMMVAFAATVILMINNREHWTKIAVYAVAFFPVCIFVLSYIPLYIELANTFQYWVKKIGNSLPRLACGRS